MKKLLFIVLLILPFQLFAETTIDEIVIFGDSLSDNGNFYKLSKERSPLPPYFEGRFSNGPVWVEYLGTELGVPLKDYAVAGAKTSSGVFPNLLTQLNDYEKKFPVADPKALYIIWGGSNNYLLDRNVDLTQVNQAVSDIDYMISQLADRGAKQFLIPSLPDIGNTPLSRLKDKEAGDTQYSEGLSELIKIHNQQLSATLNKLAKQLDITIVQLDVYDLFNQAIADPAKYDLINSKTPCYVGPFGGSEKEYCKDPNQYLFWDKVHPTTKVHAEIAKLAQQALGKDSID